MFLSPPLRMHSGLICIVICLYVCDLTKIQTRKKVTRQKVIQVNGMWNFVIQQILYSNVLCTVPIKIHPTSRCAHFNVKLHFYLYNLKYHGI